MGFSIVFRCGDEVAEKRVVRNHGLSLPLGLYIGFRQTDLLTDEQHIRAVVEVVGFSWSSSLADLEAVHKADLIILAFLDVAQLSGLGEHRPEGGDLICAAAEGMLIVQPLLTDGIDTPGIKREVLDG